MTETIDEFPLLKPAAPICSSFTGKLDGSSVRYRFDASTTVRARGVAGLQVQGVALRNAMSWYWSLTSKIPSHKN